ncbi:hypothetical protein BVG16_03450 [Paenibacillus selenitireducens]|uniref:Transcription regulator PadR N-terminal domain-containing protein n=1 Tax=Paenibacillus selenitireducens TaxID=1324314 RepID=A0A1T2XNI5_9BACL|nr:PadR family transcriptional regulator [Paenibacillus selenitireducens]OPA81378.1 hypothetical protein BVG16_03450 [Paenibacillus selenitireducens]
MSMKLAILGLLMESNSHPYELKQRMKETSMQFYMKVQEGSLYYAIDQLRNDGCIEVVEILKDRNRPDKTIYRITESGKALLKDLILKEMSKPSTIVKPICGVLTFGSYTGQDAFIEKLQRHIALTEARMHVMKQMYNDALATETLSELYIFRSYYDHSMLELHWLRQVKQEAVDGRLHERGNPNQWLPIP